MSKYRWPALVLVLLTVRPALAQVKLEWHFKEGETFFVERSATQKQAVAIEGKTFKETRGKTWQSAITVKEKTKAGYLLDLKVEAIRFEADGRGAIPPEKWSERFKGSLFKITVTPQGKIARFEGYEALLQKLTDKKSEDEKALRSLVTEDGLRAEFEEIFSFLPEKAVRKGDKWKREATEPIPPFGAIKSIYEYTLEGDAGPEIAVGITIKSSYRPPNSEVELFKVVKGSLKGEDGKGTLAFNNTSGKLVSCQKTEIIKGELLVESMGRQSKMEFNSENETRVRLIVK
jgi:hypothetical protein